MSTIGTGPEDWPELDFDVIERQARHRIESLIDEHRDELVVDMDGPFDTEVDERGRVYLTRNGERVFRIQATRGNRLLITPTRMSNRHL